MEFARFRFQGGVHPAGEKHHTADKPTAVLPLPRRLYIPLKQHVGTSALPVVEVGQRVRKGQLLARRQGPISAPVHAPTSGTVVAIGEFSAPHPSGLTTRNIFLEADGEDRWVETQTTDPFTLDPEEIAARIDAAGVVGLGGAAFPAVVKLDLRKRHGIHTLILNGAECEPYLTCDDRLMREQAAGIMDGVRIMLHALKTGQGSPVRALIAVEANKPEAIASLLAARREIPEITIAKVPTRYPMGSEKHLVTALSGQETPAQARSTDLGMLVHNVGTAYAIHQAVRYGRPLISRLVTVSGGAVQEPQNLEVPIGTLVSDLLRHCGGVREPPARLLMGGPMMGQILNHAEVPVVKGSNGILALTAREVASTAPAPCIRCARCVAVCACGLMPLEIAARIRADDLEGAASYGLLDCIGCGSCAYVCPSRMPLVQYFQFAKGELLAREQARHKARETRRLAEQRSLRLAREAQTKKALPPKPVRNRTESAPATP